jgi:glucose-6-phosphate-specific signal transduction histidine kinase
MITTPTTWSTKNKVGLGLAIFYGAVNIPSVLTSTPEGEEGPPFAILIICSVLGIVAVVAAIVAWRGRNRAAARLAAASVIIITLTSLPAFFVDVPAFIKALVAVSVLLTVAIVVLMFSPARRSTTVQD